jgi:imidazolonepropionase-like amidohydrolase
MKRALISTLVTVVAISSSAVTPGDTTALVGGRVVVGDGTVIENGTVVFKGDRIVIVGADLDVSAFSKVIDATELEVWPGLIDPFTTLGLVEVSADPSNNDANERTSTNTAQLRASDGIDPGAEPIAVTRISGVTTALVSPGNSNPINGQAAVVDLRGRTVDEMVIADPAALVLNFSSRRSGSYPSTKPGTVAMIRQTLYDAQAYDMGKKAKKKEDSEKKGEDGQHKTNLKNEALLLALSGELPVIAAARSTADIRNALAVAREFDLKLILYSPREAWKTSDELKAAGVPILLGNTFDQPSDRERYDRYYSLAATLAEAGVQFAFTTGSNHNVRQLPDHAAMAITYGLAEDEATRAVTLNPARILGIDATHGTLSEGKVANIVLWRGSPFDLRSRPHQVFIKGVEIELESRQERLRDRYGNLH